MASANSAPSRASASKLGLVSRACRSSPCSARARCRAPRARRRALPRARAAARRAAVAAAWWRPGRSAARRCRRSRRAPRPPTAPTRASACARDRAPRARTRSRRAAAPAPRSRTAASRSQSQRSIAIPGGAEPDEVQHAWRTLRAQDRRASGPERRTERDQHERARASATEPGPIRRCITPTSPSQRSIAAATSPKPAPIASPSRIDFIGADSTPADRIAGKFASAAACARAGCRRGGSSCRP